MDHDWRGLGHSSSLFVPLLAAARPLCSPSTARAGRGTSGRSCAGRVPLFDADCSLRVVRLCLAASSRRVPDVKGDRARCLLVLQSELRGRAATLQALLVLPGAAELAPRAMLPSELSGAHRGGHGASATGGDAPATSASGGDASHRRRLVECPRRWTCVAGSALV